MNPALLAVRQAVQPFSEITEAGDGVLVPTLTLMPGGTAVSIKVAPSGPGVFRVSDEGTARDALLDAGMQTVTPADRRRASELALEAGLTLDGDMFVAEAVSPDQMVSAIAYVADVSRAWATYVLNRVRRVREREIGDRVADRLYRTFTPARVNRDASVLGGSNTQHRFDFLILLNPDRSIVVDIVSPVPSSIAFAHMKFSDVRRGHGDWFREAVVQNISTWPAESLSLLGQATTHIRDATSDWQDLPAALH